MGIQSRPVNLPEKSCTLHRWILSRPATLPEQTATLYRCILSRPATLPEQSSLPTPRCRPAHRGSPATSYQAGYLRGRGIARTYAATVRRHVGTLYCRIEYCICQSFAVILNIHLLTQK